MMDSGWLKQLREIGPLLFALGFIVFTVIALALRSSWLNPPFVGAQEWAEILAVACGVIALVWGGWRVKSKFWRKPAETSTQPASPAQPLEETPIPPPTLPVQPPETPAQPLAPPQKVTAGWREIRPESVRQLRETPFAEWESGDISPAETPVQRLRRLHESLSDKQKEFLKYVFTGIEKCPTDTTRGFEKLVELGFVARVKLNGNEFFLDTDGDRCMLTDDARDVLLYFIQEEISACKESLPW